MNALDLTPTKPAPDMQEVCQYAFYKQVLILKLYPILQLVSKF